MTYDTKTSPHTGDDMDLQGFRIFLVRRGIHPNSVTLKLQLVKRLKKASPSLLVDELNTFLFSLYEKGRKATYINAIICAARVYGKYLETDKFKGLKFYKTKEFARQTLSDSEITRFLTLPFPRKNQQHRERYELMTLFFRCLAFTGCRPSEIASLTVDQVDFGRGVFVLIQTKTVPRNVDIHPSLTADLEAHIKTLKTDLLFKAQMNDKPICKENWRNAFDLRIKLLGIRRPNLSCYSLRHSLATRWAEDDVSLFKIGKQLGQKRIETTAKYVHLMSNLKSTVQKDRLGLSTMDFTEKYKVARDTLRKIFADLGLSPDEEEKMIKMLAKSS